MTRPRKSAAYIGTSGWSYEHWREGFYPSDISNEKMLEFYLQQFNSVEINNSFYHLPAISTLESWRDAAPKGFLYSVKASRYITHMKKLKDPEKSTPELIRRIQHLGDTLGPVLFQLPPHWKFNVQRLNSFLQSLSRDYRYAFEFRDPTWITDQTYDLLARHKVAFCIYELNGYVSPRAVTSDFVYIRLHGPNGAYQGNYSHAMLTAWASDITGWRKQGYKVFCYFDNDQEGYAAKNAKSLGELLGNYT